jgi:rod shape-determining protein MreC
MENFFRSGRFRFLALLAAVVFAVSLFATPVGGRAPFVSRLTAGMLTPLKRGFADVYFGVYNAFSEIVSASETAEENKLLHAQLAELRARIVEFERYKSENEHLREFLEIKKHNPGYDVEPAMVIARDASSRFYSFSVDKGETSQIRPGNSVITQDGLVGIVYEVGNSHAKVRTILDASLEIGAMNITNREIGMTTGSVRLSQQGMLRMSYLSRETDSAAGDLVVTSGIGGMYPRELLIGEIVEINAAADGLSKYAVIKPFVDIQEVQSVLIIKDFDE